MCGREKERRECDRHTCISASEGENNETTILIQGASEDREMERTEKREP